MLEAEGVEIGVVTGVQGISWTELTITGQSNHAGTTPMSHRHDAGLRGGGDRGRSCATLAAELGPPHGRHRRARRAASRTWSTWSRHGRRSPSTCATPTTRCSPTPKPGSRDCARSWPRPRESPSTPGRWRASRRCSSTTRSIDLVERVARRPGALRRGGCRRARATTPRCWRACAPRAWSSCPASAAYRHNPAEHTDDDRPRGRAPTCCCGSCSSCAGADRR